MITHVNFLSIPTKKLGFKALTDQAFGPKQRWIEMQIASSDTRFVLFTTDDGPQPGHRFNGALACGNTFVLSSTK